MIYQKTMLFYTSDVILLTQLTCLVLTAHAHACETSSQGIALTGHAYKIMRTRDLFACYYKCTAEDKCQSLNYYDDSKLCELNNRTSAGKEIKLRAQRSAFHMASPNRVLLGSSATAPAVSCEEILEVFGKMVSGIYWVVSKDTGNPQQTRCANGRELSPSSACKNNPCHNGATCHQENDESYKCACASGFTGKHCERVLSAECSSYIMMKDATRNINFKNSEEKCDSRLRLNWYRFSGSMGTRMPNRCIAKNYCDTDAPGWLAGGHPTIQQGVVWRKVCFHWLNDCCLWSIYIRVRNCGPYFVYQLRPTSKCDLRYCTE
ncbi:uromodulin [Nematostella vectensis]|uniref:uromodulin n=1 Tax=Nematostella vectensis TaxID=45351 RepID=UPI00138FF981|nr:uromodulin [Nematostella vectensis]